MWRLQWLWISWTSYRYFYLMCRKCDAESAGIIVFVNCYFTAIIVIIMWMRESSNIPFTYSMASSHLSSIICAMLYSSYINFTSLFSSLSSSHLFNIHLTHVSQDSFFKATAKSDRFLAEFYLKLLCWCQSYLDSTVHFSIEYCYSHLTSIMKKKMFIRRKIITSSKASITQVSFIISKEFSSQMRMIFARPIIHNCTMVCEFWWVTSSFFLRSTKLSFCK